VVQLVVWGPSWSSGCVLVVLMYWFAMCKVWFLFHKER
jgi:hypothetical protein